MTSTTVDKLLDFAVAPGFTSFGYKVRSKDFAPTPDLGGRDFVVTGASSGLGAATAEILAGAGATVHLVVRNVTKGEDVRARIAEHADGGSLRVWECDVSSLESVRSFASSFTGEVEKLDALVHNAGTMPPERELTDEGLELTFATNVAGPFLMTGLLLPLLKQAAPARVINVSSGGMYGARLDAADPQLTSRDFNGTRFYAHTKRCQVVLTGEWQARPAGTGVSAHAVHPGWADTPGVEDSLPGFHKLMKPLLRDAHQGADSIAWLCWAPEPLADPGRFWHDRMPRPIHRLPKTRETPADRERLWQALVETTGLDEGII